MDDNAIETLLEADGWTIECWSPLEIRNNDGSFATMQAARSLMRSYTEDRRTNALHAALTDIAGTARLAQGACDNAFEKRLWTEVEKRADSVLKSE